MKALISGEAGVAFVTGHRPTVRKLRTSYTPWHGQDALRVFDGCSDVSLVTVASLEGLDQQLETVWAKDRAFRLFLFLIDPEEPEGELREYAECVEELLGTFPILDFLKQLLVSSVLPHTVNIERVKRACVSLLKVESLLSWLLQIQASLLIVHEAFEAVPMTVEIRQALRSTLIKDGEFESVVDAVSRGENLSFLQLSLISRHRASVGLISNWFKLLQGDLKRIPKLAIREQRPDPDDYVPYFGDEAAAPSAAAFNTVMAAQKIIIGRLKDRDIEKARGLMAELVSQQGYSSTPEQIAKTLSNMSQQARRQDVPELALEWSREATMANPVDPIAFGHLANSLIENGSLTAAEDALTEVERNGDPLFAATGRARILRSQSRIIEARVAFTDAVRMFAGAPGVEHAQLGAAEALRELGDTEGALAEYEHLSMYAPANAGVWVGLASTYVDLGRIDDALGAYSKAAHYDALPALIGKASVFETFGDLRYALEIYESLLADFPNNHIVLVGRARVLQDQGKLESALGAYELAKQRSPYRVEPLLGKINALRLLGRYKEALDLVAETHFHFPHDHRVSVALISIYRTEGRFSDALIALDKALKDFPFNIAFRVSRANILSRLGSTDEALAAYSTALSSRGNHRGATLGKAALLIRLGRNTEARQLLAHTELRTRYDWRRSILELILDENVLGLNSISELLRDLIIKCPFSAERRRMRDLRATVELRQANWNNARALVEAHPEETSNVISLHVYAATHRPGKARELLEKIRSSSGPADILSVAEEIARRHQLTVDRPLHPAGWIEMTVRHIFLADAA